jgi:hypothetical protein
MTTLTSTPMARLTVVIAHQTVTLLRHRQSRPMIQIHHIITAIGGGGEIRFDYEGKEERVSHVRYPFD